MRQVLFVLSLSLTVACSKPEKPRHDDDEDDDRPRHHTEKTQAPAETVKPPPPAPVPPPPAPVANAITIRLSKVEYAVDEPIDVTFSAPLVAPSGQQYWITIVKPSEPDSTFGDWHYVAASASSDRLVAKSAGDLEVRLHDLYPQWKTGRVIARQVIKVKAKPKPEPYVPATGFCSDDSECRVGFYCGYQGNCFPR